MATGRAPRKRPSARGKRAPGSTRTPHRRLILVHWHTDEWEELAAPLRRAGWTVVPLDGARGLKRADPPGLRPAAVVISLRRLPSHGREVADAIWYPKWAREAIRIVFVDGDAEAVAKTKQRFPAAAFCAYADLPRVLRFTVPSL
jgi:hypothetical protein